MEKSGKKRCEVGGWEMLKNAIVHRETAKKDAQ